MRTMFSKGTANVSPADLKKLTPLIRHYMLKPHPFTSCYRDQISNGVPPEKAKKRCAIIKDLGSGTTSWRKGNK